MSMETDHGPDQEPEKYSFLREKIKDETVSRRKLLYKLFCLAGRGFLFGIAASISFFALKPWISSVFPENPNEIELTQDETQDEKPDDTQPETAQQEITIDRYKEMNALLVQDAREAKKSIVQVEGVHLDENSGDGIQNAVNQCAGIIAADNGRELLILTNIFVLENADLLQVTFADGTGCSASVKKKDGNIGLAVIGVEKSSVKSTSWEKIKVAELGNSNLLEQGKAVIALGNPFGYSDGMGFGVVSSKERNLTFADGEYNMLVTDMPGTSHSSGALFNVDGSVVGIIVPFGKEESDGALTAFAISTIKGEIELMLNAKDVPYIGIVGELVTKEISEERKIPEGVCVTEVMADSPAMKAGIQNGDIITHIGKNKIENVLGYHRAMITQAVGEEIQLKGKRHGAEDYVEIEFAVTVGIKE